MNNKKRPLIIVVLLIVALAAGGAYWWIQQKKPDADVLTMYGNIDIRQVQLAFNDAGRVSELLVQEGDAVRKGQAVARIDAVRYQDAVDRAQAALLAQKNVLAKLKAGSRPQEIAEARAGVDAALAAQANAKATYARQKTLVESGFLPRQSLDNVTQQLDTAAANVQRARQALSLALQGPRKEDIAAAQATVKADESALALAQRQLSDTVLYAPDDGVVENRILEVGDMAAPQTPVMTLALNNPVWVRAYVPETELGKIAPGMRADILSDSFPGQPFRGWIGNISPTAEFTPKSVETTELRAQLVYRVRVYACNPDQRLRLGMPVTVQVPLRNNAPQSVSAHVCQH
ncbi:MAG: efflux RND transporter periplasmic adaptor subunit [Thiomonas sp.]|uniref:efflux RND transporter periplasmic adaptor subunit n=1 Tax=Thiomonas sp. TaxID=2047785 RepID=UPI002A35D7A6|nr:efflux RND transporter periplasmic adaptor subunit [Thiomonas sp.]MDY0329740.1 efflux RND transporter periplasmic adaptor subunit [Thiomonas sp.]